MTALRILHITNWFAEPNAPQRVPFISEHIQALAPHVIQQLWHVEVQEGPLGFHSHTMPRGFHGQALILASPIASWQLREFLTLLLLLLLRLRLWRGGWDLVVLHIAYPLLRFPQLVQLLFGRRLLLIEHWSAYHTNFQLPSASPALRRLKGMFTTGIPVVAVSQALAADIRRFAGLPELPVSVVPNAVDTSLFCRNPQLSPPASPTFLMVASWAPIKRPLLVLAAIRAILPQWPQLRLRVIGGGELFAEMEAHISAHDLSAAVQLLGPQPKLRIASELQRSTALLHPSAYETFSVVCAEALCCGVPVLASAVGALPELITPANGRLVANTPEAWTDALLHLLTAPPTWNHDAIAQEASARFSRQAVGLQLLQVAKRAAGHL
jgi:glycosyltransferase involved in cell wall biosynthesis